MITYELHVFRAKKLIIRKDSGTGDTKWLNLIVIDKDGCEHEVGVVFGTNEVEVKEGE